MGFWKWLMQQKFASRLNSQQIINIDKNSAALLLPSHEALLTEGYLRNENFYAVIRKILDKAKPCPWLLYEIIDEQKLDYYLSYRLKADYTFKSNEYRHKALREIESNPILQLLQQPNVYQNRAALIEDLLGFYCTMGECFIYIEAPEHGYNKGLPQAIYSLPPHLVTPIYSYDYKNPVKYYEFNFDGYPRKIPPAQIKHLKQWNPFYNFIGGGLHAISPTQVAKRLIERGKSNQIAQSRAYKNGGASIAISPESAATTPMTQEQLDQINDRLIEKATGEENFMSIFATNAPIKVHKIGDTLTDLKLLEADKEDLRKICAILGVDPILMGIKEGAKYDNQDGAFKALVTNTILPKLNDIAEALNAWLIPKFQDNPSGRRLFLEPDIKFYAELQPDLKLMREVYGEGHFTHNEFRSTIGWDKHANPLADVILLPHDLTYATQELQQQLDKKGGK